MINIMLWSKLRSCFSMPSTSHRDLQVNSLSSKLSVNEEYLRAFRTKSYIEISDSFQSHLDESAITNHVRPSDLHFLEPNQQTLTDIIQSLDLHDHLLLAFFEATSEAYKICELLLRAVHETRTNYYKIKRVIKLAKRVSKSVDQYSQNQRVIAMFRELASFSTLKNPLSILTPSQFRDFHDRYVNLVDKLTSKHRKIRRKLKFKRFCKKLGGISLVITNSALFIVLLVFLFHSMVGIVAAPGLMGSFVNLIKKKEKKKKWDMNAHHNSIERVGEQLDLAAKGIYILVNDFDTLSRMVMRLKDEVEHRKEIAGMCVKNGESEIILKEVVKEFSVHECGFLEQLKELEQHIYLCCLTINRSRRSVLQQILMP